MKTANNEDYNTDHQCPWNCVYYLCDGRRGSRIQKGGFVQEFRLENRSYPDVHDFSLRMQVIIAND